METKLGRPQRLDADNIKKPRTVSLTDREHEALTNRYETLTKALLKLLKRGR